MPKLLDRIRSKPANEQAGVILMAAEAGLTDDEAKAFAEQHPTPDLARPELCRRVVLAHAGDTLTGTEIEAIVAAAESPVQAKAAAVDMICDKRLADEPTPTQPTIIVGTSHDSPDARIAMLQDGIRARINPTHEPTKGREYARLTLGEAAAESLRIQGVKINSQREAVEMVFGRRPMMAGGSHTTSDFSNILAGVVGMELAQQYEQQMPALKTAARRLSAMDFRQKIRPRLAAGPELEKVNEAGEFTHGTFAETGEYAPQLDTYGKLFRLTRQAVINDNLSAFAEIPREMARGAITTERTQLLAPLIANSGAGQTMLEDNDPLFHADHGNLAASGAALSITTVTTATTAMRRQKGLAKEVIDVRPWAIVVPPELETAALQLVGTITPEQMANVNPFASRLEVIVEPGLTDTTRWYLCADPTTTEGLAFAYLDGSEGPTVEDQMGWNIDAMEWKVRLDFGAAFVDFRGWYSNPGA